jgi:uncharacterized protein
MLAPARKLREEVWLVLALSLGASGVYAIVDFIRTATAPGGLSQATATLNPTIVPGRPWFDLIYQLLNIAFPLAPVFLAIHLLQRDHDSALDVLGLNRKRPAFDLGSGLGLAAVIGIPGLGLYFLARAIGVNATVVAADLPRVWWMIPILVLKAIENAISEEVIVVGYFTTRLRELGWRDNRAIGASALLRGSYHLYQGVGGFVGNAIMGVVFASFYKRYGRVTPLIIAHSILDVVSFVGYALLAEHWSFLRQR